MVSVERIHQFSNIASEAPLVVSERRPVQISHRNEPLNFIILKLRYWTGTPVVLKGITLKIIGGEEVGVVGRTGSGKSTLVQALFRLVEASAGKIVIDGAPGHIHLSLGLSDLLSKFAIIPQEPTLFEGTVRANIDPLGHHSDFEICEACQVENIIRRMPENLDSPVEDDGDNWSVGQKQLFYLKRALLKRAKILVLDEATSSVDAHTDWLIQKTVQESFADSPVVAHRVPTVMNCNKVLMLDAGRVKEYDSPSRLLEGSASLFAALVKECTTRGTL